MTIKESAKLIKSGSLFPLNLDCSNLFNDEFMQANTTCKSFDEMLEKNNIEFNGQEGFDNIDVDVMDAAIRSCSDYQGWMPFLQEAVHQALK